MAYATPEADDLAAFLGIDDIDTDRASRVIGFAEKLATSIVSPLPDGAEVVVLDIAGRAYANPQNVQQQGAGGFTVSYGAVSGGMWTTRSNVSTLRRLAGRGGAFTIDTMPAGAGSGLPWWDINSAGYTDPFSGGTY